MVGGTHGETLLSKMSYSLKILRALKVNWDFSQRNLRIKKKNRVLITVLKHSY